TLDVGAMGGVEVGDRFFVWPKRSAKAPASAIAEVAVVRVDASRAWVEPAFGAVLSTSDPRLAHATVSPSGYGRARGRVRLVPTTGDGERLLPEVLPGAGGLAIAGAADPDATIMAEVIETDGTLEIRRPSG